MSAVIVDLAGSPLLEHLGAARARADLVFHHVVSRVRDAALVVDDQRPLAVGADLPHADRVLAL